MQDFLASEFGFLLLLTIVVWGGFFAYLLYVFFRVRKLEKEVSDLKAIEEE